MRRTQSTIPRPVRRLLCLALIASLLTGPVPAQASTPEQIRGPSLPAQGEEPTNVGEFPLSSELPTGVGQYRKTVMPLQTDVAGTIITDTVWMPAGSPYVLTDHVTVMAGVTLTVTAGVEVQGTADHGLKVDGQLVATGTASETISFTSQAGSGGGEWDGLSFRPGSSGTLAHAIVRYGGDWDGIAYSNVTAHGAALNLDHVQLLDSAASSASSHGLYVSGGAVVTMQNSDIGRHDGYGLYVADLGSSLTLVGNTIHDNTAAPLYLWPDQVTGSELGTNSFSGNGQPGVEIASDLLHVNSTWPRLVGSWYRLMGNVTVGENRTLTLEPGVVVRALDNEGLRVDGTLVASGTLTEPVTFTSDADSGGGQWDGLTFRPGSSGTLAHAVVRYAGDWDGLAYSAVTVRGPATVVISQTQVLDSDAGTADANGLHVYGGAEVTVHDSVVGGHDGNGIYLAGSSLTLSGTTVQDNDGYGLHVGDADAVLTLISNTIQNNGAAPLHLWPGQIPAANLSANSFVGNGQPGVEVEGGILDEDADWPALAGSWYRLMDNVTVGPGVTLRLAPDTVIKGIADRGLRVDGQLMAEGTPGQPILFTSDTDSGAGQWDGLAFRPGSSGGLAHAIVRYAGNWDGIAYSGVSVRGAADLVIGQTQIVANSGSGLYVGADSRLRVEDSALTGNDGAGALLAGGTVTLTRVTLSGNTGYGLQVENDARPVVLYSFVEDNGDAGIRVENSPVVVEDTSIAGNNGAGAFLSGGIITLTHSLVISNTGYGLQVENDARSVVLDSSIMENGDAGIRVENSTVTVETSGITGNANFGIQNTSPSPIVQAVDNWWGHPSGPYHPVANPDGLGEPVSDHVAFDPWLVVPAGSRQSVALVPGQPVTDTVNLLDYKDYHLVTTAGLSLVVQVVPLGGSETIWVYSRRSDLPQWTRYDLRAQEKTARGVYELLVSPTQDGTYYFSVYGRDVSDTGGNYQIVVNVVERHLSDISPRSAGNGGEITLNLSGLGFVADMGVELRGVGLPILAADNVTQESPTSIRAHFDLTGATVGVYDVYAIWPGGGEERLEAAFEVTPGIGPRLEVQLLAPDNVRRGRQYVLELEYSNTGDADMPPPLLRVLAEGAELRFPEQDDFVGSSIQFFATSASGPAGILPPGASARISLIFRPTVSGGTISLSVSRLTPTESALVDNATSATLAQVSTSLVQVSLESHEGDAKALSASPLPPDGLVKYTRGSTNPRANSAKGISLHAGSESYIIEGTQNNSTVAVSLGSAGGSSALPCDPQVYYGTQHCTDDNRQTHIIIVDLNDAHVRVQTVLPMGPNGECNSVNPSDKDSSSNCPYPYPYASSLDYAVANSFSFPVLNYSVTGYYFGQQVGTYPDGSPRYHLGEDVLASEGTEVRAAANGLVTRIYSNTTCTDNRWGTLVIIEHQLPSGDPAGGNVYSMYGHLRGGDIKVSVDAEITKGTLIGFVGANGPENGCWEPHLHFAIHKGAYDGGIQAYGDAAARANFLNPSDFVSARQDGSQPPAAPSNLSATARSRTRIDLTWTNNSNDEDGFKIFRDGSQIATVGVDTTSHDDNDLICGTTYRYYVKAYNGFGDSERSNTAIATTDNGTPDCNFAEEPIGPPVNTIVVQPIDPNEKAGPEGVGSERAVTVSDELRYTVYFENLPAATAPAQEVVITDRLDPDLDWTTFRFDEIAFGDRVIPVADGAYQLQTRQTVADYREGVDKEWWVDIASEINPLTGQVEWTFRTLDPETGELPEDALAGFLPPNDETGRGEGHVVFSIRPNSDRPDGTVLTNQATIVFDTEASIVTNEVTNTLCVLSGDLDYNGRVDVADIMEVASRWRCRSGDDCYHERYDFDKDDDIDVVDIMLVVVHWGETCG